MACNIDKAVKDIKVLLRSDGIDKIEGSEAVKTALVKLKVD